MIPLLMLLVVALVGIFGLGLLMIILPFAILFLAGAVLCWAGLRARTRRGESLMWVGLGLIMISFLPIALGWDLTFALLFAVLAGWGVGRMAISGKATGAKAALISLGGGLAVFAVLAIALPRLEIATSYSIAGGVAQQLGVSPFEWAGQQLENLQGWWQGVVGWHP